MSLQTFPDNVRAYLWLHSLCIIYGDEFNLNWANSAGEDIKMTLSKKLMILGIHIHFMF